MAEYRNSIRSKKLIREAFAKILEEKKDINKISVKEIVERADISKSTFYCHYQDIYAVIEEFEDEIFLHFLENTMDEFSKRNNNEFMPYINKVLLTLKEK
ncbi:MAG: TetR/AcrR family transcriptional regulator [Clostridium sp.]|nr:MAG: TetR/AcrR family transcriptional regulator [Clostridium sp.]